MENDLYNLKVIDRQSFVVFLQLLHKDFITNPENWENKTLPNFLQSLASYAEDIQGYYNNLNINIDADIPNWKVFADIFLGAKIYE